MVDEHNVSLELLVGNSLNQADPGNAGFESRLFYNKIEYTKFPKSFSGILYMSKLNIKVYLLLVQMYNIYLYSNHILLRYAHL
jgi:hypothetical protein